MLQTAEPASSIKSKTPPHARYLDAFRVMLQTRIFEEKLGALYRGGMIVGGVYLGRGQEAVSAACGLSLRKGDVFAPLIRDQAGRLAFGEAIEASGKPGLVSRRRLRDQPPSLLGDGDPNPAAIVTIGLARYQPLLHHLVDQPCHRGRPHLLGSRKLGQ